MRPLKLIPYLIVLSGFNVVSQNNISDLNKVCELDVYEAVQLKNASEEEKEQLFKSLIKPKQFFKKLDLNDNGGVIKQELKLKDKILSSFVKIDINKDNVIDEDEFVSFKKQELLLLMNNRSDIDNVLEIKKIYQAVRKTDKTRKEMNVMFTSLVKPKQFFKTLDTNKDLELSREEVENYEIINNYVFVDENDDNYISEEEFLNYQNLKVKSIIYGKALVLKKKTNKQINFSNTVQRNYQSVIRIGTNPISNHPFAKVDKKKKVLKSENIEGQQNKNLMSLK